MKIVKEYKLERYRVYRYWRRYLGEVPKSLRDHAPTFDEYAEAICEIMKNEFESIEEKPDVNIRAWHFHGCKCFCVYSKSY